MVSCRLPFRFATGVLPTLVALLLFSTPAQAQEEFRAFWADAFHVGFKSTSQINQMVNHAVAGRYNAIIAEVLAYHDTSGGGHGAYWNSAIVPKANDISGGIDPLAYLCQQAHAQGIEVHAWLVTYRVSSSWPPSGNSTLAAHPEWLMVPQADMGGGPATVDDRFVLDPGSPDAQDYLVSIVRELVTNYEIDGINWDYIRYTTTNAGYPADTSYSKSSLARFQEITGFVGTPSTSNTSWSNFRRRTISELIRRVRAEIPSIKSNPRQPLRHTADLIGFGNAPSTCGGFTSTSSYQLHQNWREWMQEGWLDAAIPMNYKREHCSSHGTWYRNWVDRTNQCWKYDRHVFNGQANYLNTFANSVIQMQYSQSAGANGLVNYSYASTKTVEETCDSDTTFDTNWYNYVASNLFTTTAITPGMPWRDPQTATEGTVWGQVISHATGQPVDDATVVVGTFPNENTIQTDGNGYYTATLMPALAAGTEYDISVTKSGEPGAGTTGAMIFAGDVTRYDFRLGAPAAVIDLSPAVIDIQIEEGQSVPDGSFTIQNTGTAPLNYFILVSAGWLDVSEHVGNGYGELDNIDILYDTLSLPIGVYGANIVVFDDPASNSPQAVTINLSVTGPIGPGDFDVDGDVDMADYAYFQICLTGENQGPPSPGCESADFNNDNDVDGGDVAVFMGCMSGAGMQSDVNCTN